MGGHRWWWGHEAIMVLVEGRMRLKEWRRVLFLIGRRVREYLCRKQVANVGSAGFVYGVKEGREGGDQGRTIWLWVVGKVIIIRVIRKRFRRVWRLLHVPEARFSIDILAFLFPKKLSVFFFDSQIFEICMTPFWKKKSLMAKEVKSKRETRLGERQVSRHRDGF